MCCLNAKEFSDSRRCAKANSANTPSRGITRSPLCSVRNRTEIARVCWAGDSKSNSSTLKKVLGLFVVRVVAFVKQLTDSGIIAAGRL